MGAIRWTAKGLKLAGELLEAKEFEEWVESKGKELVEKSLKGLFLSGLRGEARAKSHVRSEVEAAIRSETLRASLQKELETMPLAVLDVASHLAQKGPRDLVFGDYSTKLVVCPRGLTREHYTGRVLNALKDSFELSRFTGLAEVFLRRIAYQSEDAYFSGSASNTHEILPGKKAMLVGTDSSFGWDLHALDGHYYVAIRDYGELEKKGDIKELLNRALPKMQDVKAALGRMPPAMVSDLKNRLPLP